MFEEYEKFMKAIFVATGRASHAGQVKGDDPNKKGYPAPPGWGLGHGADNSIPIK
jgi:hypothetical protein